MPPSPPPPDDRDEVLSVLEAVRPEGVSGPPPDWLRLLFRGADAPFRLICASARGAPEAVPWLAAILDEDDLSLADAVGDGHAPMWAAHALRGLPGQVGVDALVRAVVRTDEGDWLRDAALEVLWEGGGEAIEAMFRAWASYPADSDERFTLIDLLAEWPEQHPRIREALLATLAEDPPLGSELISACGDPELTDPLRALWDAYEVDEADPKGAGNGIACQVGWALADVDTEWSDEDDGKLSRLLELTGLDRPAAGVDEADDEDDPEERDYLHEDLREILDDAGRPRRPDGSPVDDTRADVPIEPLARREAPGRNDPCWCGSGKKYKKCHLETDATD